MANEQVTDKRVNSSLIARMQGGLYPWMLIAFTLLALVGASLPSHAQSNMTMYFVHNDHLGTPDVITNQDQEVVWRAQRRPFGETTVEGAIEEHFRFSGQTFDGESGLAYNYHRYYDPGTGRYITSDPLGLAGGINTYGYAMQNPLRYTDPEGLQALAGALPLGGGLAAADGPFPFGDLLGLTIIAGAAIYDMCQEEACPPCRTVTGRIVPVGTIGYRPLDVIADDVKQHGVYGSHHNIFVAKQALRGTPQPCKCFWQKQKYVLKSEQLTPSMVPVEEFVYTGG